MKRKRCSKCRRLRLLKFFYRDRRLVSQLKSQCRFCSKAYSKKWKHTNRAKKFWKRWGKTRRLKRYNVTDAQYAKQLRKQKRKCVICKRRLGTNRQPHIDHDHKTKVFRGILCSNCNTLLGLAKDSVCTLRRAIKYLIKYRRKHVR